MTFPDPLAIPHISFRYDGKDANELLPTWQTAAATATNARGTLEQRTFRDHGTGLSITIHTQRFTDFPAIEWVAEFENAGAADTPLIENIQAMDIMVPIPPQERLRLHHANGSLCRMDDFLPQTTELPPHTQKYLAPIGGRSSNGVLPFMNLQRSGAGMVIGIGWSGQWCASWHRDHERLRMTAGQQQTRLRLQPGEKIRTPRILILPWEGNDPELGNNLLRQLLLAHYVPRIGDTLVMPPVAQCLQAYFYLTGQASERFEMKALPKAAAAGVEVYWIDACWYGNQANWWEAVGSWDVNRERFPNGVRPIRDAAHAAGMKFILWVEPERVRHHSLIHRAHPEFLLASEHDTTNFLFDLGNPDARRYLTELLSDIIAENGLDIYRQDFNTDPLPYWQAADAPDRSGMTENRYVQGLYTLWDELRQRHPGLWIDNCASGGRRIDLETLSRSLSLWPSDFFDTCGLPSGLGLHVGDQCINAGLARWVPLFGGGVWNFTPYGTRSEIIGGFTFGFHIDHAKFPDDDTTDNLTGNDVLARGVTLLDDEFPLPAAQAAIREWRSVRPFFTGDFHLLLPLTAAAHDWCAWQLHRADLDAGIALLFRRHRSPFPAMNVTLKRVDPDAFYTVSISPDYVEAAPERMTGRQLAQLSITIPDAPGSVLLRYTRTR